uniref:Uncharacterized protein n=1 Tax=Salvator merianae TaxID=96440 RepID=A0A8D0CD59_SALMN
MSFQTQGPAQKPCICKVNGSSLICNSRAGCEVTTLLYHGSYIKLDCLAWETETWTKKDGCRPHCALKWTNLLQCDHGLSFKNLISALLDQSNRTFNPSACSFGS